jgi:hypothetical protein
MAALDSAPAHHYPLLLCFQRKVRAASTGCRRISGRRRDRANCRTALCLISVAASFLTDAALL